MPRDAGIERVLAVPHFHFDVEWWKVKAEYSKDVAGILDKALELLEGDDEFRYAIDQALAIEPYLEQNPELVERFADLARAGKIEFVGGSVSAPDENLPLGEALIRQFVVGKRYFKQALGVDVTTAWEIDEFGHSAQMPQILTGCGFDCLAFARGVEDDGERPVLFNWEGPDGSRILTHWFAGHYAGLVPLVEHRLIKRCFEYELKARLEFEGGRTAAPVLMLPLGTDFVTPTPIWRRFIREWNRSGKGPELRFGLPGEYFAEVRRARVKPPVVKGEFNPLFTGGYESREKVKRLGRKSQFLALEAEKLAAAASLMGGEYPVEQLDEAWWLILTNDFHDIMAGTGTDKVYRATLKRYGRAMDLLDQARAGALARIASEADTRVEAGIAVAVFNSLGWERAGVVEVPLSSIPNLSSSAYWGVLDHESKPVPAQISNGKLLFAAAAPSVGFRCYNAAPAVAESLSAAGVSAGDDTLENEYLKLKVDASAGGMVSILHKPTGRELIRPDRYAAGELLIEEDAGNLWTVQKTGDSWLGRDGGIETEVLEHGPIRGTLALRGQLEGIHYEQKISLVRGVEQVFIETVIDFYSKDRRIRLMVEPAVRGEVCYETPFHLDRRPDGHWPTQTMAAVTDGELGLALINTGSPGYEADDGALGVTLMRSVSIVSDAFLRFVTRNAGRIGRALLRGARKQLAGINAFEQEMYKFHGLMLREYASEGGAGLSGPLALTDHLLPWLAFWRESDAWERGRHVFKTAIAPFQGPELGPAIKAGWELNTPLIPVFPDQGSDGSLGRERSLLTVRGGAMLSALKQAPGGKDLILRVYDPEGRGSGVEVEFFKPLDKVWKANFLEEKKGRIEPSGKGFADEIGPWKVQTYCLRPGK